MRMRLFVLTAGGCMLLCFGGCGRAQKYYTQGLEAFGLGQYEDALLYYTKAVEENPNKAEYYIEQGHTYAALGQYAKAREALELAVVEQELELTKKNNKRAWRAIGITYYEEKDYINARLYFEKALSEAILPELDADIRMYLADTLECEGDYEAAIAMYDILLSEREDYAAGYRARAYMRYILGEYEESLADYDAAISLEPKNFDLYFGKYNVLGKLGKASEQLNLLEQITAIENPTSEDLYFIAKARYFNGDYDVALDGLITAAENGYEDSYFYAGEICRTRNDYGQAINYYEKYIAGSGAKDAAAYNQMAICQMRQDRLTDALETVLAGQKLPDTLHVRQLLFNEVVIHEKMGNYNTAYERAAAYIREYPEDGKMQKELEFLSTRVREES